MTVTKPVHGFNKDDALDYAEKLHGHLGDPVSAKLRKEAKESDKKNLYDVEIEEN